MKWLTSQSGFFPIDDPANPDGLTMAEAESVRKKFPEHGWTIVDTEREAEAHYKRNRPCDPSAPFALPGESEAY